MATFCLTRLCSRAPIRQLHYVESRAFSALKFVNRNVKLQKHPPLSARFILHPSSSIFCCYSGKAKENVNAKLPPEKKTLFQRFKQMYRDYWYVLVPVHLITSAGWFGGFYYLAKSGVDTAGLLESWHVSEKITNSLRDSSMGYIAVSYALYKIATPLRYTVTLGGTTISINYLKKWGYIKPVPSKDQLKEMYKERKENIMESIREKKDLYKEKKHNIVRETKVELQKQKDHLKAQKQEVVKDIEDGLKEIIESKKRFHNKELAKASKKT